MISEDDGFIRRVNEVLDGENSILEACREYLDTLRPAIDAICDNVQDINLSKRLIYRCIAKRVEENFGMVIVIAETSEPFMATLALRPLCEDLIYGCWLATLPASEADEFVGLTTKGAMLESLRAQANFLPRAYANMAFLPEEDIERLTGVSKNKIADFMDGQNLVIDTERQWVKEKLKALGTGLGWSKGRMPTVYAMASQCQMEDVYGFFYHGSSKAVHSDLHRMSQMVSGSPGGAFTISSRSMARSHSLFALTYGIWLTEGIFNRVIHREFADECLLIDDRARSVWLAMVLAGLARNRAFPRLVK
jgi:hypothetical protein